MAHVVCHLLVMCTFKHNPPQAITANTLTVNTNHPSSQDKR